MVGACVNAFVTVCGAVSEACSSSGQTLVLKAAKKTVPMTLWAHYLCYAAGGDDDDNDGDDVQSAR